LYILLVARGYSYVALHVEMIRANDIKLKHKKMGGHFITPLPSEAFNTMYSTGCASWMFQQIPLLTHKARVVYCRESIVAVSRLPQTQNNFVKYYVVQFTCKI
jgi:hypothetical protein